MKSAFCRQRTLQQHLRSIPLKSKAPGSTLVVLPEAGFFMDREIGFLL